MNYRDNLRLAASMILLAALAGCNGEKKEGEDHEAAGHSAASAPSASGAAATGDTITIEAYSDGAGNYFKPNDVEAHPGDVLHFVLKSGVHNVHFLPDSNKIKTGLPPASEMLQLPDQAYDLVVTMQPGHYYWQCDPHAMLGMKGKLEVEEKD
jgi:plastocyanin